MAPSSPHAATTYLVLRHLYEGDIIGWPLDEAHPQHELFASLESQGLVARWDRIWPLSDRYRLTEKGIAAIEAIYNPATAEALLQSLRVQNLTPAQRRAALQAKGFDPAVWPILHDPYTHWSTVDQDPGRTHAFFWEDQLPPRRVEASRPYRSTAGGGGGPRGHRHDHDDSLLDPHVLHTVVDLDREAADPGYVAPIGGDVDVS
ncbi:MAG: hypothetical protein ABI175_08700 [Polyangiales bacterium]